MSVNNDPFNDEEVNDLEFSIEQAIDDLFVPLAGQSDNDNTDQETDDQAPAEFSDIPLSDDVTEAINEIGGPTIENKPNEIPSNFLDPINASLLSLDWEINLENIKSLQQETNQLANILQNDRHSMIIVKMIMIVLKYLLSMKEESSPISIKLLHTAIKALALIHNPEEEITNENQKLFINLKNEFRLLKNDILAPSLESADKGQGQTDGHNTAGSSSFPPSIMVKNIQGLTMQMIDILEIMQKEINRLSFMDKLFDNNPSLAEAKDYFDEIKKDFSTKINDVLSIDSNLIDMLKQLNKKIIDIEENRALTLSDESKTEDISSLDELKTEEISSLDEFRTEEISPEDLGEDLNEPLPDQEPTKSSSPASKEEKTAPLAIYIAQIENHKIGIPESFVANIFELAPKKAQKLNERGYVTLVDFQKRFKGIKHGLNDNLNSLSAKVLKKLKFPVIKLNRNAPGFDDLEAAESQMNGIILLSNGLQHAALFTNEVKNKKPQPIDQYTETNTFNEIKGTATIGEDSDINIIDVEYILSYVV